MTSSIDIDFPGLLWVLLTRIGGTVCSAYSVSLGLGLGLGLGWLGSIRTVDNNLRPSSCQLSLASSIHIPNLNTHLASSRIMVTSSVFSKSALNVVGGVALE